MSDLKEKPKSRIKELLAKQKRFAEKLVEEAKAYYDATGPVEVETVFGETAATVLVPFVVPERFQELTEQHPPRPGNAVDTSVWFNLHAVARNYPGVTVVMDDEEDDLRRIEGDEIRYLWPEVFDAMPPEDQQNFHMAVWSMHVWEPKKRLEAIKRREAEDSAAVDGVPLNELVDAVVAVHEEGVPNG